ARVSRLMKSPPSGNQFTLPSLSLGEGECSPRPSVHRHAAVGAARVLAAAGGTAGGRVGSSPPSGVLAGVPAQRVGLGRSRCNNRLQACSYCNRNVPSVRPTPSALRQRVTDPCPTPQ